MEIFPAKLLWPKAVCDINDVEVSTEVLRLDSKVKSIDKLPGLLRLKRLWCFDVNDEYFKIICQCDSLQELYIDGLKLSDVHELQRLKFLKILFIDSCSKIENLTDFGYFKNLKGLGITNFKKVHDLGPLSILDNLESLVIAGGMVRSARMEVKNFLPLANLEKLSFLHLTNIIALDMSLKPLENLIKLRNLDIANFYPMEEFAGLSGKLRNTKCVWFKPYIDVHFKKCRKCGKINGVMLSGGSATLLCKECDAKRLISHVDEFNKILNNQ